MNVRTASSFCLIAFFCFVSNTKANCKTSDISWTPGKGPKITQPDRNNPGKIKVDWTDIVKNGRCADKYFIWIWDSSSSTANGAPNFTLPKETYSKVIKLDACVQYNFKVGYFENDLFNKEKKNSSVATFKTEADPTLVSTDRSLFTVGFYWDHIRRITDFSKASIKFPKSILKHTSCLKHIEARGILVPTRKIPAKGYLSRFSSASNTSLSRSGSSRSARGDTYRSGGSGSYSGGGSGSHSAGGSGSYSSGGGGSHSTGGSGSYSSSSHSASSGSSTHSGSSGGSGGYGGNVPGTFGGKFWGSAGNIDESLSYPGHDHSIGKHGRGDWNSPDPVYRPRGKRAARRTGYNTRSRTTARTTTRPPYVSSHSTSSTLGQAKISPPFLTEFIEIVIPIKPCGSYTFSVNFISPRGSTMGSVKDLLLPELSEIVDYHPPSLSEIFRVSPVVGTHSEPTIGLYPNTGIPIECVPHFLQAVDRHMGHMEDEVRFHTQQEFRMKGYANFLKKQLTEQKQTSLKSYGCTCAANMIKFNSSTPRELKEHKSDGLFGEFFFEGLHNGKPYFRRPSSNAAMHPNASPLPGTQPLTPKSHKPHKRNRRFIGEVQNSRSRSDSYSQAAGGSSRPRSSSLSSSSGSSNSPSSIRGSNSPSSSGGYGSYNFDFPSIDETPRQPPPPNNNVFYIFWNLKEKAWWVGVKLDAKKPLYKTDKNSSAKCPADSGTTKKWKASHTFSWKIDPLIKAECVTSF